MGSINTTGQGASSSGKSGGFAGGYDDNDAIAAINVVPLVDIILVVLIIFMVTAPLVLKPTIDIQLPKAASGKEAPARPLEISMRYDGQLLLNGKESSLEHIAEMARQKAQAETESVALLTADRNITLDKMIGVIDTVKMAGIKRVAFHVEQK